MEKDFQPQVDQQPQKKEAKSPVSSAVGVNPKLNADSVRLNGENLGGEGENKNVFYARKKYNEVPVGALEQKAPTGQNLLVNL